MADGNAQLKSAKVKSEFSYLSEKVRTAEFGTEPYKHIYLEDFLSPEHFEMCTQAEQINLPPEKTTEALIERLQAEGYQIQEFPGCTTSVKHYLRCYKSGKWPVDKKRLEGFGITFRLIRYKNPKMEELIAYLNGDEFKTAMEEKFGITRPNRIETAIQKYLTGYEISPHPDIRSKCLTYLVNINTSEASEGMDFHTHMMTFKPEKRFIYEFWKNNQAVDTDWVPWDWCETRKFIRKNNSLIMFAPSYDTLHAIKLRYDHLPFQRTQIYGNLWYTDCDFLLPRVAYEGFEPTPDYPNSKKGDLRRWLTAAVNKAF